MKNIREKFEEWATVSGYKLSLEKKLGFLMSPGRYKSPITECAWQAFKTAIKFNEFEEHQKQESMKQEMTIEGKRNDETK